MMGKVYVKSSDVWNYFEENKEELQSSIKVIAECNECGVQIWITEDSEGLLICVMVDDEDYREELVTNSWDCKDVVESLYQEFLTDNVFETLTRASGSDYSIAEQQELIDDRELEIDGAMYELLSTLFYGGFEMFDIDSICDDLKEHICEYLYRKHNVSVYRPMYLECEDGTEEFCEFPYDEMEFDN